jgi:hypothetical protein
MADGGGGRPPCGDKPETGAGDARSPEVRGDVGRASAVAFPVGRDWPVAGDVRRREWFVVVLKEIGRMRGSREGGAARVSLVWAKFSSESTQLFLRSNQAAQICATSTGIFLKKCLRTASVEKSH